MRLLGLRSLVCVAAALCLACRGEGPDEGTSSTSTTGTADEWLLGEACEVEGERRCYADGRSIFVCEAGQWAQIQCSRECRDMGGCVLGCLTTEESAECLCVPTESGSCS